MPKRVKIMLTIVAVLFSYAFTGCVKSFSPLLPALNNAPVISVFKTTPDTLQPNTTSVIDVVAADPENDRLNYEWMITGGSITGSGTSIAWKVPAIEGIFIVSVSVKDGRGGAATRSANVTVSTPVIPPPPNNSPVIYGISLDPYELFAGNDCTITATAADSDGDTLHYSWSDDLGRVYPDSPSVTFSGCCIGSHSITLTLSDGKGGTAAETANIDVQ